VSSAGDEASIPPPPPLGRGAAALSGAAAGAAASLLFGLEAAGRSKRDDFGAGALALALGVVLAPIAALIGAGVGAAEAHPQEEIDAARESLERALRQADPTTGLRHAVVAASQAAPGLEFVDCHGLSADASCVDSQGAPVAMLVQLGVMPIDFEVEGEIEPGLRLRVVAEAHVRLAGQADPWSRAWTYRGCQQGYFELAAHDAELLRAELNAAELALATRIIDDLTTSREWPPQYGLQPEGSVWVVLPAGPEAPPQPPGASTATRPWGPSGIMPRVMAQLGRSAAAHGRAPGHAAARPARSRRHLDGRGTAAFLAAGSGGGRRR
jgi:hypothetical protein